jgi:hypothetical protein
VEVGLEPELEVLELEEETLVLLVVNVVALELLELELDVVELDVLE